MQCSDTWLMMHQEHEVQKSEFHRCADELEEAPGCMQSRFYIMYWNEVCGPYFDKP